MQAVILAGGMGTRLRAAVAELPKPMAPIGSKPFLAFVLDNLAEQGISEVVISVGYRREAVIDFFGECYRTLQLRYCVEEEPLGTGGAVLHALPLLRPEPFLVMNGDTLVRVDCSRLLQDHLQSAAEMTLVLRQVPDAGRYGRVEVANGIVTGFSEKGENGPGLINCGMYVLSPQLLTGYPLPASFSLERDFLGRYVGGIRTHAHVTDGYFIDIGIPEDYRRAQRELAFSAARE